MKRRQAKKILSRWTKQFGSDAQPKEVWRRGLLPWSWGTWSEAHRVISKRG